MKKTKNIKLVSGYFLDEKELLGALKRLKEKQVAIKDVFTPFPVHGLDHVLELNKSRLPTVGFLSGTLGAVAAFTFQAWVFTKSYPMNIGGKPFLSIPTFIPIIFETTVLFAALAMVFAFLFRSKLGLGAENKIYDPKITDNHFLILLATEKDSATEGLKSALQEVGAQDIKEVE